METVEIIASGYEWICPNCGILNNDLVAVPKAVKCDQDQGCKQCFIVAEHHHCLDT